MVAPTDIAAHVIRPDDPGYDDARAVFNAMIDRRPLAIVRCRDARDVAAGIRYARDHDLVLSVRGGGHGVAGNAVCDGGIMLDLSGMKDVAVDPAQRIAHAGPGLLLGELDAATQRHGLATPLGVMSGTGIAGLTLGGGLGWLNARYGLTCDNLIGAEVVTAGGDILKVGPDEHPDLLWGLRGGGGNLAVVTSFIYRLHPVSSVLAGALTHPWAAARDVLRHHHAFMASAPDELTSVVSLGLDPAGTPAVTILVCWSGDPAEGERVLAPAAVVRPATRGLDRRAALPRLAAGARPRLPARPPALLEVRLPAPPHRRRSGRTARDRADHRRRRRPGSGCKACAARQPASRSTPPRSRTAPSSTTC